MAKRRNEKTVSLFPFLAVLVCTMGALILLLLVTTRRIRQKQQEVPADVIVVESAEHRPDPAESEPNVALAAINESVVARATLAITRWQRAAVEKALEDQRKQHAAELQQLNRHQQEMADLQNLLDTERDKYHSASFAADAETRQISDLRELQINLEQRLDGVRQSIAQALAEMAAAESLASAAEKLVNRRHSALQSLRDLSMHQKDRTADTGVAETVIEFSNSAGTARTPIVVDVTDQGFVFTATKVKVRQRDMDGASATDNPLLSGVLAIHRERSSDAVTSRPYVLLLVRPGGTLAFYLAQRVFREARVHFGYELMSDEQVIAAAKPVDGETEAVRAAVLNSLMRRDKRLESTSSIRRRIAALRDAERGRGRHPRIGIAPESRRQYVGEPYEDSDFDAADENPFLRDADLSESKITGADRNGSTDSHPPADDGSRESPMAQDDSSGFPAAPTEVWQSIPSIAEARTHVEEELARALAAREAAQLADSMNNGGSAVAPQSASERPTTIHLEDPVATANDKAPSPDEWSNDFGTGDSVRDEFWTAMQPLAMQPSTERHWNDWPRRTESAANQSFRSPAMDGQAYRPNDTSRDNSSSSTSAHGPNPSTTATIGGSGVSNRLISYEQITIYLDPQHYTVVGHRPVALHGQTISQIISSLADRLFEVSRRSPHPLAEMTLPAAKFVVSPGAHTLYLQLAAELHDLNIPVASIVSMDAHVIDRSTGFISVMTSPAHRVASQVSNTKELP